MLTAGRFQSLFGIAVTSTMNASAVDEPVSLAHEAQTSQTPPLFAIVQLIKAIFNNTGDASLSVPRSKELSLGRELIYDLVDCVTHVELIRRRVVETSNNTILFHNYYEDQNKYAPASRRVLTLDDHELEQIRSISKQSNKSNVNMRDFYLLLLHRCLGLHLWHCLSAPRSSAVVQCLHTYFPGPRFTGKRPLFMGDLSPEEYQDLRGKVYDKFLELMADVARWDEERDRAGLGAQPVPYHEAFEQRFPRPMQTNKLYQSIMWFVNTVRKDVDVLEKIFQGP